MNYQEELRRDGHTKVKFDATMNVRMPKETKLLLEAIAKHHDVAASDIVRWAIADYLEVKE